MILREGRSLKIATLIRRAYGDYRPVAQKSETVVFGFGCTKIVKYRKELNGETSVLKELAALSEKTDGVILAAFDTDNYGVIRHSCGIFEKGRLLGITDMSVCLEQNGYMPGCGNRVFDTGAGRLAVAVGDDAFSFDLMKSLVVCGAETIFLLSDRKRTENTRIVVRAYSYLLGVPFLYLAEDGMIATDPRGKIVASSEEDECFAEIPTPAEYSLKITKVRLRDP